MGVYTVRQNEDVAAILFRECGTTDVSKVLEHPDNKKLFQTRTEYILRPGDKVWLPDAQAGLQMQAWPNQGFVVRPSTGRPLVLKLQTDKHGVLANAPYSLHVSETILEGTTDGNGTLKQMVPHAARKARLNIAGASMKLELAALDPPHTVRGVQGRLANMGYYIGRIDGKLGPQCKRAIKKFQKDNGLSVDGIVGPKTRAELVDIHGC